MAGQLLFKTILCTAEYAQKYVHYEYLLLEIGLTVCYSKKSTCAH